MSKKTIRFLFIILIGWRLGLLMVSILANQWLVYQPSFPYAEAILAITHLPRWIYSWGNFDGVHYLTIANHGYIGTGLIQAFFPFYPGLIALSAKLLISKFWAGILISHLALIGLAWTWLKLIKSEFSEQIAKLSLIIWLLFPTAFFFGAIYNEALFLFFALQSFYWTKQKKWGLVSLCLIAATATRLVGIFLIPALLIEIWPEIKFKITSKNIISIMAILAGAIGLLAFMVYLNINFHDPLYFLHVQSEFGAGRQESLILWPQVVWRYIKIIFTYQPYDWKFYAIIQEFLLSIAAVTGLFLAIKKIKWSYLIFAFGAYFLPTLTGTFSSMPRYILVCFPLWIWLALILNQHRRWQIAWLLSSGFLLILNTMLFIQGYWVS